jgi:hypothetical protein
MMNLGKLDLLLNFMSQPPFQSPPNRIGNRTFPRFEVVVFSA